MARRLVGCSYTVSNCSSIVNNCAPVWLRACVCVCTTSCRLLRQRCWFCTVATILLRVMFCPTAIQPVASIIVIIIAVMLFAWNSGKMSQFLLFVLVSLERKLLFHWTAFSHAKRKNTKLYAVAQFTVSRCLTYFAMICRWVRVCVNARGHPQN